MIAAVFTGSGENVGNSPSEQACLVIARNMVAAQSLAFSPGASGDVLPEGKILERLQQGLAFTAMVDDAGYSSVFFNSIVPAIEYCYVAPASNFSAFDAMRLLNNLSVRLPANESRWVLENTFADALKLVTLQGLTEQQEAQVADWQKKLSRDPAATNEGLNEGPWMV